MTRPRRQKRPARQRPRGRPVRRLPSMAVMRERGPKPPDAVIARLTAVLEAELAHLATRADAEDPDAPEPGLSDRWKAALALALLAIGRAARRGVVAALAGAAAAVAAARAAAVPLPADPTEEIEESVRGHLKRGALSTLVAAAIGVMVRWVLREHARAVEVIARAAGSESYLWITRRDERVRPLHAELESTVQRWDDPPLAGLPSFHGHPGQAGGCRCTPWPLL
jgi:hypothetical protein